MLPPRLTFSGLVSLAVVVVSILTAATGLLAARSAVAASELEQKIVQQVAVQQQQRLDTRGEVASDLRLLPRLREHVGLAYLLERDAARTRSSDPGLSRALEDRALAERSMARALGSHIRFSGLLARRPNGALAFSSEEALRSAARFSVLQTEREIDPEVTATRARQAHDETVGLIAWTAVFVLSLVFFTLARVTPSGWRTSLAATGGVTAAAALVLVALGQPLAA